MRRGKMLYEGKAKRVYEADGPGGENLCVIEFKDDATAMNGEKHGVIEGKGALNCEMAGIFFNLLAERGVRTHFVRGLSEREMIAERVRIVPLEVVVRNIAAGSLAKRFGWAEGRSLDRPVVEFYYKNDELGDPLLNRSHIRALGIARDEEVAELEREALRVNGVLAPFLAARGLDLVDFKLEFGRDREGGLLLADEVSPDTCRLWDAATGERLDKDRFRRDLGGVSDAYREVLRRIRDADR